ncbi:MAG TPA: hypothetical protein VF818_06625, partial [Ktedonobacterales bacterium]
MKSLAEFGILMLTMSTAFAAAVYVHEHVRQWEASAVFVSLGLGILPATWYVRTKRYGWLAGIVAGLLLGFSLSSAFLHGWTIQAQVVIGIAVCVFFAVVSVLTFRITRRVTSALRAVDEEVNGGAPFRRDVLFRDDGERITVYPSRRKMLPRCALTVGVFAIFGGIFVAMIKDYRPTRNAAEMIGPLAVGLLEGMLACALLAMLYRLAIRRPTLVVGPDGIVDHGSLIGTGVGLLRWHEILSVAPYVRSSSRFAPWYLNIVVTDAAAVRRRQPVWKWIPVRVIKLSPWSFGIWEGLLSVPVDDLAGQIDGYVKTHAPPGWFG